MIRLRLDTKRLPANVMACGRKAAHHGVTVERVIEKEVPVVANSRANCRPDTNYSLNHTPDGSSERRGEPNARRDRALDETVSLTGKTEPFSGPVAIYKAS